MKLEVLMSVMYQDSFDIAFKSKINSDLLIINQCDKEDYQEIQVNGHLWRMIYTKERGLSKSRNMALKNAKGDICLLADDDEELEENYEKIITQAYYELPKATVIVFNLLRKNNNYKKKYYNITKKRIAPKYRGYGSPAISFKLSNIINNRIFFNEKFGSGTEWGGGEDSLFIDDIRKNKLTVYEYPNTIAIIDYSNESKWFLGYNEKLFYNVGAYQQYRYDNKLFIFLFRLYLCYKLRRDKQLTAINKYKWMCIGARGIKNNITYEEYKKN